VLKGHTGGALRAAFHPGGELLASAAMDGSVLLWDVATGTRKAALPGHTAPVIALAFGEDGKALCSLDRDGTLKRWDVGARKLLAGRRLIEGPLKSAAFTSDGRALATARPEFDGPPGTPHGLVRLWDPRTGAARGTLPGHELVTEQVAWTADGGTLLTRGVSPRPQGAGRAGEPGGLGVGGAHEVRLWDVARKRQRGAWPLPGGTCVGLSPDGKMLGVEEAHLWEKRFDVSILETRTGQPRAVLRGHRGTFGSVLHVAFSPGSRCAVTSSMDRTVRVWDVVSGGAVATLRGHTGWVLGSTFSPDGSVLASAGLDGTVRLWSAR
jgi:WD40 repeat protein